MARRGRRRGGLHAAMGRKRAVAVAASVTVAATEDLVQESEPEEEQQPQDEPSELRCSLTKEVKCEEPETVQALEPETSSFLFAMERDAVVKIGREFELPFKKDELKRLEERTLVRHPPLYGKITKCVYVSQTLPVADPAVQKCNCYESTKLASSTRGVVPVEPRRTRGVGKKKPQKEQEIKPTLCGENCHNRILMISCSEDTCSAPDPRMCSNRAIQRKECKAVRVEYIHGPGFGLIAEQRIRSGEFIIEYVGEVIDDEECERRLLKCRDAGENHFYMLELEKDVIIDARYRSNESRFINHSCDPNSVIHKWNVDGVQRIGIFSRREIQVGEEITMDYNFSHFGEAVACKCGTALCRGKIGRKSKKYTTPGALATIDEEPQEIVPAEIKRPVHVSSLALLKSSQLDQQWLHTYGYQGRRLFLSHRSTKKTKQSKGIVPQQLPDSSSSSPASEWASSLELDVLSCSSEDSNSHSRELVKSLWYENVIQGSHLAEVRRLQSYICGGKSDWSKDLAKINKNRSKKNDSASRQRLQLRGKRLSLLEARDRAFKDIIAFANHDTKWSKLLPSSRDMDPDRILRFVKQMNNGQRFLNQDLNDLNEDACHRCGLAGELICCDGCPAAFHLCCANLVMVPPQNVPWFCAECKNPRQSSKCNPDSAEVPSEFGLRRQLRTQGAPLLPSRKRIFHSSSQNLVKRRYKKRMKGAASATAAIGPTAALPVRN